MAKRIRFFIFIGVFLISLFILFLNVESLKVYSLPDDLPIAYSDVEFINQHKTFGKNISVEIGEKMLTVGGEKTTIKTLIFKLFGFLPIKTMQVNIEDNSEVFIGGAPIGFAIDIDGLIILGGNSVLTDDGLINNFDKSNLQKGDILISINDKKISSLNELQEVLSESNGEEIAVKVIRKEENITLKIKPIEDNQDNKYKLGLWVKNDATGVGTLTYAECATLKYGALGHPITDYETGAIIPTKSGKIFNCNVVGLNKGEKGNPGEIKGVFMQGKNCKGNVERNTKFGVFGQLNDKDKLIDNNKVANIGSRLTMKPGKATLVSNISGVSEDYEIEIIKANYQPKVSDKSFVFRVIDERLINLTGGIIQGMSGSPILQNGKIVGAVTHVFISDPTKGYGAYVDWMIAA